MAWGWYEYERSALRRASEDASLAGLAHGGAPLICSLACRQEAQMFSAAGLLAFSRKKRHLPLNPACSRSGVICCWFAVSFCVQVAGGNKSRLMGQGGGFFLLKWPFFFPKPGARRERGWSNEYIFKCLYKDVFQWRDLTLEVWVA